MRLKILVAVIFAIVLSGCSDVKLPSILERKGLSSSQESEFLKILETDKYLSICNQQPLYAKVLETEDDKLMVDLLIAYTQNLANGCINIRHSSSYEIYKQRVSPLLIKAQIKADKTIEEILHPFVPQYRQFNALSEKYKALERNSTRAIKIRKNIERVKLMKTGFGSNYALVNIPEFFVRVIENDTEAVKMRVIVGTRKNKTPIFTGKLQYIVLNPRWSVPNSIAKNEIVPKLIRNPNYLSAKNMIVRKGYDSSRPNINPASVDWKQYKGGKGYMPYNFVQKPSGRNALGRVKFIFPNSHSVYMHDTPNKRLFNAKVRTFSHGCIRLHKPVEMLNHISTNYTGTSYAFTKKLYDSRKTKQIRLKKKLPVHTAYLTSYVDDVGVLISSPDAYGYDRSQTLNF